MILNRCLTFLLFIGVFLTSQSQSIPQQVTIDAYLGVTFPGKVTHFDSSG
jgi:hypothetical protein